MSIIKNRGFKARSARLESLKFPRKHGRGYSGKLKVC
jgi:hypothetical protein